jgi:hypothetical protein
MKIEGRCHCGNISFDLDWPGDGSEIPVRTCSCDFCTMRGGSYTSHRDAHLSAVIRDPSRVSRYRFGTRTAEFYVCSRCGAVPFVTSMIRERLYAVVNVNTFVGVDRSGFSESVTDFEDESVDNRLERRAKSWIPNVSVREGDD